MNVTEGISNRFMIAVLSIFLFKVIVANGHLEQEISKHAKVSDTIPAHFIVK